MLIHRCSDGEYLRRHDPRSIGQRRTPDIRTLTTAPLCCPQMCTFFKADSGFGPYFLATRIQAATRPLLSELLLDTPTA
jgi:hypothetical protein